MKLTLINKDGTILEQWDLKEYDLTKTFARQFLMQEIADEVAKEKERGDGGKTTGL